VSLENVTDASKAQGTTIVLNVTLAASPSISAFDVWVRFDPNVLSASASSIDFKGNILGSDGQVQSECINNEAVIGSCGKLDAQGVVNLGLYYLGNKTTSVSGGLLFRVTLTVLKIGFSQIHLLEVVLANGVMNTSYTSTKVDGLFTNEKCGLAYCTPPFVDFTVTPAQPAVGSIVTFNASASRPTNVNARVANYTWFWDEICNTATTQIVDVPTITHAFCNGQTYSVGLTVSDTLGIVWSITKPVQVVYVFVDVRYGGIDLDHQFGVYPGDVVHVTAAIVNNSTAPVNANLTIRLDTGVVLGTGSFNLSERGGPKGSSGTLGPIPWDTTNYIPRVYRIDVKVTSNVHQNVTTDKSTSTFVQVIVKPPSGNLSLSLFQTTGLGIIVIIGLAAGLARFRRRPSWEKEPL